MSRILFIVKFRVNYDGSCGYDGTPHSFGGLYHSALFVVQMLRAAGVPAKLVQVCDNNDIDREVAAFRPDIVVIEALWVVPSKFSILSKLHPKVRWVVRLHSELPFLANEGIAMQWIEGYVRFPRVSIGSNSKYGARDIANIVGDAKVHLLPNFYPSIAGREEHQASVTWNIGCFGAIRPLKNQLLQALAAIEFARLTGRGLRFHINARDEQGGGNVLKNLRALFRATGFQLIEHDWEVREDFLNTIAQTDVGMQVSLSETFDITAADTVSLRIPLVTSREVIWACDQSKADATNTASIVQVLRNVTGPLRKVADRMNLNRLRLFCAESKALWLDFCNTEPRVVEP